MAQDCELASVWLPHKAVVACSPVVSPKCVRRRVEFPAKISRGEALGFLLKKTVFSGCHATKQDHNAKVVVLVQRLVYSRIPDAENGAACVFWVRAWIFNTQRIIGRATPGNQSYPWRRKRPWNFHSLYRPGAAVQYNVGDTQGAPPMLTTYSGGEDRAEIISRDVGMAHRHAMNQLFRDAVEQSIR